MIRTLILNGSPHLNGDTSFMITRLAEKLSGETRIISAYNCKVAPCVDCRMCRIKPGCAIDDEMQEIYGYLEQCSNVVIASPIYFSEITGKLLDLSSRFKTFFSAKFFRNETPLIKPKKGAVILAGGGTGDPQKAYDTSVGILHCINVRNVFPLVCSHNTDIIPASEDKTILPEIQKLADFLNK